MQENRLMNIEIIGIPEDEVTVPKNDGTRGSALYKIPLKLSGTPSREWARLFAQTWDRPPRFTTMHRPGIARVSGDRILLDGTTIEELQQYHLETLKLVVKVVNEKCGEEEEKRQSAALRQKDQEEKHRQKIQSMAKKMNFGSRKEASSPAMPPPQKSPKKGKTARSLSVLGSTQILNTTCRQLRTIFEN